MHNRFLLLGSAASLLLGATAFADPVIPRAAKVAPTATSSVAPVKTPMPAATAATPLSKVSLNPQPLPPKVWGGNPGAANSLNPQPLPPKVGPDPGVMKVPAAQAKAKTSSAPRVNGGTTAQQP